MYYQTSLNFVWNWIAINYCDTRIKNSIVNQLILMLSVYSLEYKQNICMEGNGLSMPIHRLTRSVTEVMVMETAASDSILATRSGTFIVTGVRLHAANITKVSSMPIPTHITTYILIFRHYRSGCIHVYIYCFETNAHMHP